MYQIILIGSAPCTVITRRYMKKYLMLYLKEVVNGCVVIRRFIFISIVISYYLWFPIALLDGVFLASSRSGGTLLSRISNRGLGGLTLTISRTRFRGDLFPRNGAVFSPRTTVSASKHRGTESSLGLSGRSWSARKKTTTLSCRPPPSCRKSWTPLKFLSEGELWERERPTSLGCLSLIIPEFESRRSRSRVPLSLLLDLNRRAAFRPTTGRARLLCRPLCHHSSHANATDAAPRPPPRNRNANCGVINHWFRSGKNGGREKGKTSDIKMNKQADRMKKK